MKVFLKRGRDKPVSQGHPWIFSGAVDRIEGNTERAGVADVLDCDGHWLGRGTFQPHSQIRVRVLTHKNEEINQAFFFHRFATAASLRRSVSSSTDAYRLVNGEGDFLPGLVVDRYADFLVCQFFTSGIESLEAFIVPALTRSFPVKGVYGKSQGRVRAEEGLLPETGVLWGEEPPSTVEIRENGVRFGVDIRAGQKTGFFLDQRENRQILSRFACQRTVLDCFAYTGSFTTYALRAGAKHVVAVESSRHAASCARHNFQLNGDFAAKQTWVTADVSSYLKESAGEFEVVVLDPPSLARQRRDVEGAARAYKFLNLHALRRLGPHGLLFTFCCSQHVPSELFQKIVFSAAVDAGRSIQTLRSLGPGLDHPVSLHHPEGNYLKGLLLRAVDD